MQKAADASVVWLNSDITVPDGMRLPIYVVNTISIKTEDFHEKEIYCGSFVCGIVVWTYGVRLNRSPAEFRQWVGLSFAGGNKLV